MLWTLTVRLFGLWALGAVTLPTAAHGHLTPWGQLVAKLLRPIRGNTSLLPGLDIGSRIALMKMVVALGEKTK